MKNYLKALFSMAVIFMIASCTKTGADENKLDDRLVGTKWETSDFTYKLFYGGNPYEVYEFTSTTEVDDYVVDGSRVVKSYGTYTYTLDYPKLTINRIDSDGKVSPLNYTFKDSRTFVRDNADNEYSPYAKYIKQ